MDNRAEQERKELNKKLLRRTFTSEMKDRKKMIFKYGIEFVAIFIGLLLTDWIVDWFAWESEMVRIVIGVVLIVVMQWLGSFLVKIVSRSKE